MKRLLILATCLSVLLVSVPALAQDEEVERDVLELTLYGGLALPSGDISDFRDSLGAKSGYDVGIDFGVFLSYDIVLGASVLFSEFGIDNNPTDLAADGLNHRLYSPSVYVKYYFGGGESYWQPYVKGQVGVEYAKFTSYVENPAGDRYRQLSYEPGVAFGVGLGLFYYTADYGGLFVEANYKIGNTAGRVADYEGQDYKFDADVNLIDLHAGVRILFGGG